MQVFICLSGTCGDITRRKRDATESQLELKFSSKSARKKRESGEETDEELALRSYGSRLRYQCGLARKFQDSETERYYSERWMSCNWNKTWSPTDQLDPCVWVQCINPPAPPEDTRLALLWEGQPVHFQDNVSYTCHSDNLYFELDKEMVEYNVSCLEDGTWDAPEVWPVCLNCKISKTVLKVNISFSC